MAVLAGAGITPAAAASGTPVPSAAPTSVVTTDETGDTLRLDPSHVQQVRERADRLMREQPPAPATLGGATMQAATVNPRVVRHSGADRYATAEALANAWWVDRLWNPQNGPIEFEKVVFVASGEAFPDALSGGAAAAAWGGPVLLTKKDTLLAATRRSLDKLKPDVIVVLGGPAAISTDVEKALRAYVRTPDNVTRVGGADRYQVSARTAGLIGEAPVAYVASGVNYPDGLAGGAAAGTHVAPLLLSKPDDVPTGVMNALRTTVKPKRIFLLGGTSAVNDDVFQELRTVAPVTRITGKDRYEVAAKVADQHATTNGATIAIGGDWPDALAGSAFAGLVGDKLLLVKADGVPLATQSAMQKHGLAYLDALGGVNTLPESVLNALRAMRVVVPRS